MRAVGAIVEMELVRAGGRGGGGYWPTVEEGALIFKVDIQEYSPIPSDILACSNVNFSFQLSCDVSMPKLSLKSNYIYS